MASTWRDEENATDKNVDVSTEQNDSNVMTSDGDVSGTPVSDDVDMSIDEKATDDALDDIDSIDVDNIEDGLDDSGDTDTAAIADNSGINDTAPMFDDVSDDDKNNDNTDGSKSGGIRRTIISIAVSAFAVGLFAWLYMTFAAGTLSTGQTDNLNVSTDNVAVQDNTNAVGDFMDEVSETIGDIAENAANAAKDAAEAAANKQTKTPAVLPDGVTVDNVCIDSVDNTEKGTVFSVALDINNDSGDTIIPSDILFVDKNGDSGSVTMSIKNGESDEELTVRSAALDGDCGTTVDDGDTKTVHVNFRFDFYEDGFDDIEIRYLSEENEYETKQIEVSSIDFPDYVG